MSSKALQQGCSCDYALGVISIAMRADTRCGWKDDVTGDEQEGLGSCQIDPPSSKVTIGAFCRSSSSCFSYIGSMHQT